jgi:hypothetical protein
MPHAVIRSKELAVLSPYALKLLLDLLAQYRGKNNGDLCAAWTVMRERGWRSKATLQKALKELLANEWIEVSRQGGRNLASLYAVTFFAVNDCGGKHALKPTQYPKGLWQRTLTRQDSKILATRNGSMAA